MSYTAYHQDTTGQTIYAKALPLDTGTWATGVVSGTENGTTGSYAFTLVDNTSYVIFIQAGGSPASTDTPVADIDGSTSNLAVSSAVMYPCSVDTAVNTHTPTTTEFQSDTITEATTDHYVGRRIIFTSGVLTGQGTAITGYSQVGGIGQFTVVAMTEAPSNNDQFIIV